MPPSPYTVHLFAAHVAKLPSLDQLSFQKQQQNLETHKCVSIAQVRIVTPCPRPFIFPRCNAGLNPPPIPIIATIEGVNVGKTGPNGDDLRTLGSTRRYEQMVSDSGVYLTVTCTHSLEDTIIGHRSG